MYSAVLITFSKISSHCTWSQTREESIVIATVAIPDRRVSKVVDLRLTNPDPSKRLDDGYLPSVAPPQWLGCIIILADG